MTESVLPDSEAELRAEIVRLNKIVTALMNHAEREAGARRSNFGLFQNAVTLENQVRRRTAELQAALRENERINRDLTREREEQRVLIKQLEEAHNQLLQAEKLASIGQLAAGVAHEVNNPIGFVNSNLGTLKQYIGDLFELIDAYQHLEPELPVSSREGIKALRDRIELPFLREDLPSLITESIDGTARVRRIVQDLRDFSREGDADWHTVDIHAGLESTLNVVSSEIRYKADIERDYGQLPEIYCLPSQLNQVFLNLLLNAAQAIPEHGTITLRTRCQDGQVFISVSDTGAGIAPEHLDRIFDPFFTTKPVGKGVGLGLSVTYGIVEKHGGRIEVDSVPGKGSTFTICLPVRQGA